MNFSELFDLFYSHDYEDFDEWMSEEYENQVRVEDLFKMYDQDFDVQIKSLKELIQNYEECSNEIRKMNYPYNRWLDNAVDNWDEAMREDMERRFRSIVEGMIRVHEAHQTEKL